jgi:glutamate synthase domain-containing protein 2
MKGKKVPDLAMAGGFSTEDGVYKALAMGAPFFKAVCMGRALMIPGFVGKNIGKWIAEKDLPKSVAEFGSRPEEIFVAYEDLSRKLGDEIKKLPMGAIGIYTYTQKFRTGLQQLMAGSRRFRLSAIGRQDVMALTEEAARISKIPYIMDAYRDTAEGILDG